MQPKVPQGQKEVQKSRFVSAPARLRLRDASMHLLVFALCVVWPARRTLDCR
jgi:hypothetical protein